MRSLGRAAGLTLLMLGAACASKPRAREPKAPDAARAQPPCRPAACLEADGFVYATPSKTKMALPARFEAPRPSSLEELAKPASYPSHAQLRRGLCRGDAGTRARYLASLRKATAGGALPKDQSACLALGPRAALRSAVESGLLLGGDATEAEALGKAYEDAVIRKLREAR